MKQFKSVTIEGKMVSLKNLNLKKLKDMIPGMKYLLGRKSSKKMRPKAITNLIGVFQMIHSQIRTNLKRISALK